MIIKKSIFNDAIISFVFIIVLVILLLIFSINIFSVFNAIFYNSEIYSIILNILLSALGMFGIILTLFTVFEEIYSKNRIIIILKKTKTYNQIFERYIDSIIVLFFSIVIFFLIYILTNIIPSNINDYLNIFKLFLLILCFIRIYRCLELFLLYKDAIKNSSN
jgi:hypothetical protein